MRRLTISLLVLIGFLFFFNARPAAAGPSLSGTATFVGTDTTTLGGWTGTYGTVGSYIPNGPSVTPSDGSTFNPGAASLFTWGTNVASGSALKTGTGMDIASCWYKNLGNASPSLTLDVDVTSGSQTVALYLLDYDKQGRSESVSVTDTSGNPLEGPHGVSGTNFANGEYLLWTITGEVHITITLVNGPNAVASGIFFGESTTMPPPVAVGAYINRFSGNATPAGHTLAYLTLPAGSYILRLTAVASTASVTQPTIEVVCGLQDVTAAVPISDGTGGSAASTFGPTIPDYGGLFSLATELEYTIAATHEIAVSCVTYDGGTDLIGHGSFTATPYSSIVVTTDGGGM